MDSKVIQSYYMTIQSILSSPNTSRLPLSDVKNLVDDELKNLDCDVINRDFLKTYLGQKGGNVVWSGKPGLEMLIESVQEVFSFPTTLLNLKCNEPVLFIKGENSSFVSDSLFPNTQKIFTNAKLSAIQNAGHFPHLSNTKCFMEEVLTFLNTA